MTDLSSEILIRPERPDDAETIFELTQLAFANMPFADGDEGQVIERLRDSGNLTLSLVALIDDRIVGQVTFSPARFSDDSEPWFALGPVSVAPDLQRRHIGSALIEDGLSRIHDDGALGCILTGNPDYYRRFGFELSAEHAPTNEPEEYFMLKSLRCKPRPGRFEFHPAFYDEGAGS